MTCIAQHGVLQPLADEDSRWWWEGIAQQRLLLPRCTKCARYFFPPQPTCPYCGSSQWEPIEASGHGRVYSWVVVHVPLDPAFQRDVPYTIAAVELDEGPRVFGRVNDEALISEGAPAQAIFYTVDDVPLLGFKLLSPG